MKKRFSIVVDEDVYNFIKKQAKEDNRSISNYLENTFKVQMSCVATPLRKEQ